MDKSISLEVTFKPFSVQKINDQFTVCKCYVMALGKNRNLSHFTKESVDSALPTLFYVPVVANLQYDEETDIWYVGGHDREWTGDHKLKDLTVPYGVVLNSETAYEDVVEPGGAISTYLTCSIILWTGRYCDLLNAAYSDDVWFGQSMEILPHQYRKLPGDERYTDITSFTFSCLTLLGKSDDSEYHVEPCFPSASVVPYASQAQHSDEFKKMFAEMKTELEKSGLAVPSTNFSAPADPIKEDNTLDKKMELLARFGVKAEDLSFSIDDMELDELEAKLTAMQAGAQKPADPQPYTLNLLDRVREIRNELEKDTVTTDWGYEMPRYWLVDIQGNEVIAEDYSDNFNLYGIPVMESGDAITLELSKKKRKKRCFEDFDFGDKEPASFSVTSEMVERFSAKIGELLTASAEKDISLQTTQANYADLETKYNALNAEFTTAKASAYQAQKEDLWSRFDEKLSGTAEYEALKADTTEFSIAELEQKCFALVGQKAFSYQPAKKSDGLAKFGVSGNPNEQLPYGGLIEKHMKQ